MSGEGRKWHTHLERIRQLMAECERKRPTGTGGKHDDLHTDECGCGDLATEGGQPCVECQRPVASCRCAERLAEERRGDWES